MTATAMFAVIVSASAAAGAMWLALPRRTRLARKVRPYTVGIRASFGLASDANDVSLRATGTTDGILLQPLHRVARQIGSWLESRSDEALALKLYQAGRSNELPSDFRMQQVSRGLLNGAVFAGVAIVMALSFPMVLLALGCGVVAGVGRVRGALERAITQRAARMELELYTVNQLLALHVRSGAGPMQAVQRVVDRGSGALIDELSSVLTWVRSGLREQDAFDRAAEVTPCKSAARTYRMFALATERGSDLGQGLLAVGDNLRDLRRESLKQRAVKQRAAMLAPTIGVLAPIMLLFVAAPLPSVVLGGR